MTTINWELWLAFLGVVGVIAAFLKWAIGLFIPTRKEFTKMQADVEALFRKSRSHTREIDSIYKERKSFRAEVLDSIKEAREEISSLKDLIIETLGR